MSKKDISSTIDTSFADSSPSKTQDDAQFNAQNNVSSNPESSIRCNDISCNGHDEKQNKHAKLIPKPALKTKVMSRSVHEHKDKPKNFKNKRKVRFNSKDEKSKSVQQTDEEKLFIIAMKPFVVQAVSGTFIALLNNRSLDNITSFKEINPMLTMFLRIYLNVCWHGYGKKNDSYVVNTFNTLFEHEIIKRVICLIDWIDVIGRSMINAIDLDESIKQLRTMSLSEQRNIVTTNMQIMYSVITSELSDLKCTDIKCITSPDNIYDGEDFFVTDE